MTNYIELQVEKYQDFGRMTPGWPISANSEYAIAILADEERRSVQDHQMATQPGAQLSSSQHVQAFQIAEPVNKSCPGSIFIYRNPSPAASYTSIQPSLPFHFRSHLT